MVLLTAARGILREQRHGPIWKRRSNDTIRRVEEMRKKLF